MKRLEQIVPSQELAGIRVIVTGCGYRPLQQVFCDIVTGEPSHDPIFVCGKEMKMNIGSATAGILARAGANVHMVSTSEDKLRNLKASIDNIIEDNTQIEFSAVDLSD